MSKFPSLIFIVVILLLYLFFLLQSVAYFTLLERHILGLTQNRFGPKKTSWYGLLQPIVDGVKLLKKEQILIFNCTPRVFLGVTVLNFGLFYIEFLTLPYPFQFVFMNWGYLMVILLVGVNLTCILIGGVYSKRKYAFLGSMRRVVASISYEVTFNLNMLLFMLYHKSYGVKNIRNVGLLVFFMAFFIRVLVELSRTPFDYSESERDLVSGFNTEYSRASFVLLFLKEYGSLLFFSVLTSTLFFGGYFIARVCVFCFIILLRRRLPRLRTDATMSLIWLVLFFHIRVGLFCTFYMFVL